MKRLIRSLAAAAIAATAFAAAPAFAHDRDHDRREPCDMHGPAAYYPVPPAPPARAREERWGERREVRREYAELEGVRARFYSTWHGPGQVRKFERWYSFRKAELDRRWYALAMR